MTRLEASARRLAGRVVLALPESLTERVFSRVIGYGPRDVPAPITPPAGDVRLLIAPANYAGQGYEWARASRSLTGVGATNLHITPDVGSGFRTEAAVPSRIAANSRRWSTGQWESVRGFTHVLVEAERPLLGQRFGGDIRREVRAMLAVGLRVAFVSHGSDIRFPSRHAADSRWSPFNDADWALRPTLESVASRNLRVIDEFGLPVFVATPDLLADVPTATWLPNIVDVSEWKTSVPVLTSPKLRVLHAPTNPVIKGTALIEPAVLRLQADGLVDYRLIENVPPTRMRVLYENADVVLDQFRLGIYSTTSIEAMAAGRIVIARLSDDVRRRATATAGMDVPIVQADPDSVADVLRDIADRPGHYAAIAARGPEFVGRMHSAAKHVLREFVNGGSPAAWS
jgi:hypothetical protein